jgi:tripartite-type tricarboxylate transporter receptor subunit TctC
MKKIAGLLLAVSALVTAAGAAAQPDYPGKPVRIVVGFTAGGAADIVARMLAQGLTDTWKSSVIVENVPGAGGSLAGERVSKAAADGHTLLVGGSLLVINPSLYDKIPYDTVRDFAPISQICFIPNILVINNDVPARSVGELVALARAQPGKLTVASAGNGSVQHITAELFKSTAEIDIQHVPYKGAAYITDLLGGRVTMAFPQVSVVLPTVGEGKLRALAVTSAKRTAAAPDIPTMAESGFPGFEVTSWFGVVAPARTPTAVVAKLHRDIVRLLALPETRRRLADIGAEPIGNSPEEFSVVIKSEIVKWARVIRQSGARPD